MKFLRKNANKINKVVSLYISGYSLTSIEKKLKIERHLLKKMLMSQNIAIRNPGFYRKGKKLTKKHIEALSKGASRCNKGKIPHNKLEYVEAIWRNIRSSAKKRNLTFSLTRKQVKYLISSNCFYCGIPPQNEYRYRINEKMNGIDRLMSWIGYKFNNCVSCCSSCNRMKMDDTPTQFLNKITKIAKFKKLI